MFDFVQAYSALGAARLHMPGHKGKPLLGPEALDITEIQGADELYAPEGILSKSEKNAAFLFGTGKTLYSTEGSSQCIRAMLRLALLLSPGRKTPAVLAARNVHSSFVYGCALCGLEPRWMLPDAGSDSLCSCLLSPSLLEDALSAFRAAQGEDPVAVYVTSPDYLGRIQPLAALSAVCRRFQVPFLVDNAHGAYLRFLPEDAFPRMHPMDCGADLCADSAHKTLPALTGCAYLHMRPGLPAAVYDAAENAMALFGSTSPSYLLLQSLDLCNRELAKDFPQKLSGCVRRIDSLRSSLACLGYRVQPGAFPVPGRLPFEPLKLVLHAEEYPGGGHALAARLRAGLVECEFCDRDHVVLMFSPYNADSDFQRILQVVSFLKREEESSSGSQGGALDRETFPGLTVPPRRMSIRDAVFSDSEIISVENALGRVCAAPAVSCPPAVPIAVAGEELTQPAVNLFRYYHIDTVRVVCR